MALSNELAKLFAKTTNDNKTTSTETTVYGTIVENDGTTFVKIDGSEVLTPVKTTASIKNGDRVTVMLKNHTAMVTGNITAPSASSSDVDRLASKVDQFEIVVADVVTTEELQAEVARIDTVVADNVTIHEKLTAMEADIGEITAGEVTTEQLNAVKADVEALETNKLDAATAEINYAKITDLNAATADISELEADNVTIKQSLTALEAEVDTLEANQIDTDYLNANYANITLANVEKASIGTVLASVGLITDATIMNGKVTGYLDSVEVNANKITAGTLSVDRLIFRGSTESIVYELNNITGALQVVQSDTLNGEILTERSITVDKIVAKSITANELAAGTITADELNINNIFGNSAVLSTLTAQQAFIDAISTNSIVVGASNNAASALSTANSANANATNAVNTANSALAGANSSVKTITMHYLATSAASGVTTSTSGWTTTAQSVTSTKKYLWTYQTVTTVSGTSTNTTPVISGVYGDTGATGATGATGPAGTNGTNGTNGVGVSKVIPLYYLKSNTTAPSAPTAAVSSTSVSSGVWTTAVPTYVSGYTYFTCTQTLYTNNTYGWSTVVTDNGLTKANSTAATANTNASNAVTTANTANTNANTAKTNAATALSTANTANTNATTANNKLTSWSHSSDTTYINGGKIYTGSITAGQIAAGAITADKLNVTDLSAICATIGKLTIDENGILTSEFLHESLVEEGSLVDDYININYEYWAPSVNDYKVISGKTTLGFEDMVFERTNGYIDPHNITINGTVYDLLNDTTTVTYSSNGIHRHTRYQGSNSSGASAGVAITGLTFNDTIDTSGLWNTQVSLMGTTIKMSGDTTITKSLTAASVKTSAGADLDTLAGTALGSNTNYVKFGNYVIQWGLISMARSSNTTLSSRVTFPIAFVDSNYTAHITLAYSASAPYLGDVAEALGGLETAYMDVRAFSKNSLFTTTNIASYIVNARWVAIGRWK